LLYTVFDRYQKGVEEFYKFFEEDQSPPMPTDGKDGRRPQNMKLNPNFIPDSYTAEIENYWEFLIAVCL